MTKSPDPSASGPPPAPATETALPDADSRRDFLAEAGAIGIGTVCGLTPLVAGAIAFADPLRPKKYPAESVGAVAFQPLTRLENLPEGAPQQIPVFQDKIDAWTVSPNEPVGAVYAVRKGNEVVCFNAVCPHAGCFVGYDATQQKFVCPCHDSSFTLDGKRNEHSPSQRDLDMVETEVDVKTGEVKVKFQNFLTGKSEKVPR